MRQVLPGLPVQQDHKVHRVLPAQQVVPDLPAQLVLKVRKDQLAQQAHRVHRVPPVRQVVPDPPV